MTSEKQEKAIFAGFERIFSRLARRAFNVPELEQLRTEVTKIVGALRTIAERVALDKCKKLNDAVLTGFTRVSEDIEKIEKRLAALESARGDDGK